MEKAKRRIFDILPRKVTMIVVHGRRRHVKKVENDWIMSERSGATASMTDSSKAKLLKRAVKICRKLLESGQLCQLVIHKANGKIASERTYGKDPRRTPG